MLRTPVANGAYVLMFHVLSEATKLIFLIDINCTTIISSLGYRRRDVRGAFVPGKLRAYLDAQYAPLSEVIQAGVVRHADQLVRYV